MFTIEQTYTLAGLTVLCRAARKTVRRGEQALRVGLWCLLALLVALAALLIAVGGTPDWWTWLVLAGLIALQLGGDRLNAWVAMRQLLPGSAHSTTVFTDEDYTVTTDTTETVYHYENITRLCESGDYLIFFLGTRHGQMFDKRRFSDGGSDSFRAFIEQKTGKTFQAVK